MRDCYAIENVKPLSEHGYCAPDTAEGLTAVASQDGVLKAVEIGSFCGLSAGLIGKILKPKGGTLWCVDPWKIYDQLSANWDDVYQQFLSNMIHWGLQDTVIPVRSESIEAAPLFEDASLDMVYVDGYHSKESVKADIIAWWPKLRDGGILCGDDFAWAGVSEGISEACAAVRGRLAVLPQRRSRPHYWQMEPKGDKHE